MKRHVLWYGLPERRDAEAAPTSREHADLREWHSRAEFYNMPGITYFDSMADLKQTINTLDTVQQSRVMHEHNRKRLQDVTVKWMDALSRIDEHGGSDRQMPVDFDYAMETLFGQSPALEVGGPNCNRLSAVDEGVLPREGDDFSRRQEKLTTAIVLRNIG